MTQVLTHTEQRAGSGGVKATSPDGRVGGGVADAEQLAWIGVVALVLTLTSVVLVAARTTVPSDGTITAGTAADAQGIEIDVLGTESGLRANDVVEAIEGVAVAQRSLPSSEIGQVLRYQVRRGDERLTVDVQLNRYPLGTAVARNWALVALVGTLLGVASYVYRRKRHDSSAQDLLLVASLLLCGSTASIVGLQVLDFDGGPGWWANLVGGVGYIAVWPALLRFALRFPRRSPVVERHPTLPGGIFLVPVGIYAIQIASRLPGAETPLERAVALVPDSTPTVLSFTVLILAVSATNYVATKDAESRRHLRLLAGTFGVSSIVYLAIDTVPSLLGVEPPVAERFQLLAFLPCPVALGFAILRRNLFDLDVAVRRSVVYAVLSTCVIAVYAVLVGIASRVAPENEEWTAALFTGLVAVAVSPLHQHMRRFVGRLIYGARDDPYAVISVLGERLQSVPAGEILKKLVETLGESLRLPHVAIRLFNEAELALTAQYGVPTASTLVLPLTHRNGVIGELEVGERVPGEGFGARDRRVLENLAEQIALVVRYARLALDLQASREHLVMAREEERRRIRRDLHDGFGPALAATALQLQAAARMVCGDPAQTKAILEQLADEVQVMIRDIRRLVEDLRPPSIDQLGLVAAVEEVASRFSNGGLKDNGPDVLVVSVEASGDLHALPAAAEVAAYRIVCEALNNVYKHAKAHVCHVRLDRTSALEIEITDDGTGLATTTRHGVGLHSMQERASELGGTFLIENRDGHGTRVWASIPVSSA